MAPATGLVVAAYEYDGYGQITQTVGTLVQPYGYTGREYDPESGLCHYRARAYDPAAGVLVQEDPIGFAAGTLNSFGYVSSNPFNRVDPTGLSESAALLRNAGLSTALSGIVSSAISIETMLRAARTMTAMSSGGRVVQSGWWDDVFGNSQSGINEEIKAIEGELEYCEMEKMDRDNSCARRARKLKDNDAQPWHIQSEMAKCLEKSQLQYESCAKPLWQRLSELRRMLRDLP